jgi:hypothetical protein
MKSPEKEQHRLVLFGLIWSNSRKLPCRQP